MYVRSLRLSLFVSLFFTGNVLHLPDNFIVGLFVSLRSFVTHTYFL